METYLIAGERGKREIIINGAAARHAQIGDQLIILTYALMNEDEVRQHQPRVVVLGPGNNPLP
jgi:aspartate 1-decarboxylase